MPMEARGDASDQRPAMDGIETMSDDSRRAPARESRGGAGGRRLAAAFDAVGRLPALAEAHRRLLSICEREAASPAEVAETVETDTSLAIVVMRAANNGSGPPGRVAGVREAVESLEVERVRSLAAELPTYDVLAHPGALSDRYECFRRHAVAVRSAGERVGELARLGQRDELAVAALLHDVGRLVMLELYGQRVLGEGSETPEELVRAERRELGIDHALVGAVLIRRWGLAAPIATAVERHHAPDATGHAAAIRLADMIVHHGAGRAVSPEAMREVAAALGIDSAALGSLVYEYPHGGEPRRRLSEPCPLSSREIEALRGLAEGKVYKQIAQQLSLSVSTVRTHLHNVYRKIGAVDRAQAVLMARDRGWI